MQVNRHFRTTDFQTHIQSLRLWVLEILAWMVGVLGVREGRKALCDLRSEVRRDIRELLFAMIVARMRFPKRCRTLLTARPYGAPRGFRFANRCFNPDRFYTRGIALKTFAQMRAVLDDIEKVVASAFRRVRTFKCPGALVAVAPPAQIFAPCALAPAPDAADTS